MGNTKRKAIREAVDAFDIEDINSINLPIILFCIALNIHSE